MYADEGIVKVPLYTEVRLNFVRSKSFFMVATDSAFQWEVHTVAFFNGCFLFLYMFSNSCFSSYFIVVICWFYFLLNGLWGISKQFKIITDIKQLHVSKPAKTIALIQTIKNNHIKAIKNKGSYIYKISFKSNSNTSWDILHLEYIFTPSRISHRKAV